MQTLKPIIWLLLSAVISPAIAQKLVSERGQISFFSDAALEDISAVNKKAVSILSLGTGDIGFSVQIKEFKFDESLMEEHFNEKYMNSDTYPKSTFQGKVSGLNATASGVQNVKAIGKLTLHGVTRDVEIPGTLENQAGKWQLKSKFKILIKDYKIEIPQLLWEKVAEEVEIAVDFSYKGQ
jgi:hypothetical protein